MISANTPEKFFALTDMRLVRLGSDNTLLYPGLLLQPFSSFPLETWIEIRPGIFQSTSTSNILSFKDDENGQVRYMAMDNVTYWGYVKQPWHGRQDIHLGIILVFSLLTFLLTILAVPVAWIISRIKPSFARPSPWQARLARGVGLGLSLMFIAFVVNFILHPFDPGHISNRIMAWVFAILSLFLVILAIASWRRGWWKTSGRLHYTFIALAGVSFTWFMAYWNLLMLN